MDQSMMFTHGWPYKPAGRGVRVSREEMEAREQALRQAPLFAGISKRHLRAIAQVTAVLGYPAGKAIITEGHVESGCYVILEGQVRVASGGRTVTRFGPGDFVGEISLLDPGPRTASVIAEGDVRCLTLAGEDFRGLLEREPVLTLRVVRALARRLRETDRASFG